MRFKSIAVFVFVWCMLVGSTAWGAYEKSGLILYPTDGTSLVAMNSSAESRGFPVNFKLTNSGSGVSAPYTITSGVTFSDLVTLEFENGAMFGGTANIKINPDNIIAGPDQRIFDSGVSLSFTSSGKSYVGWAYDGSDGDGAFQMIATAMDGVGGEIIGQGEIYNFDAGVVIPITEDDSRPEITTDFNVPKVIIRGQGAKNTTFKATSSSITLFSSGSDGSFNLPIEYHDFYIYGDSSAGGGVLTDVNGIYMYNFRDAVIEGVKIEGCDGYGIDVGSFNGEKDSTTLTVENCWLSRNTANLRGRKNGSKTTYGYSFKDCTFQDASGVTSTGIGMELDTVAGIAFDNVVFQSNGRDAGLTGYGYGTGLKLTSCGSTYNGGKLHFEDHNNSNEYWNTDIFISGTTGSPSSKILLENVFMRRMYLRYCENVDISGNNLQSVDANDTAIYSVKVDNSADAQLRTAGFELDAFPDKTNMIDYMNTGYADYDSETGRLWAYKSGRHIDETDISSPYFSKGTIENYLTRTSDIDTASVWVDTSCTVTASATTGPHGLLDNTVFSLLATANSGNVAQAAETTWDGWYTFTVWIKLETGNGNIRLELRDDGSTISSGTVATNRVSPDASEKVWRPYSVTGYSTSTNDVDVRILIPADTDEFYIWNPILNKGRLPTSSPVSESFDPVLGLGAIFPGEVYFGKYPVGNIFVDLVNAWSPGNILDGAQAATNINASGASLGDYVSVSSTSDIGDLSLTGHVRASGSVRVILQNLSGGAIDPGALEINIRVWGQP